MIVNRLTDNYFTLKSFGVSGTWKAGGGTTIADGGVTELTPTLSCRQIELTGGTSNSIYIDALTGDESFKDTQACFVFAIKIPSGGVVSVSFEDDSIVSAAEVMNFAISGATPSVNAQGVASPQWSIIRAISPTFTSNSPSLIITITIAKNENEAIYFTSPVLVPQLEFLSNNTALRENLLPMLPDFMLEDDFTTVEPIDMPLARFMDVATSGIDNVVKETLNMTYLDILLGRDESNNDTLSTWVDTQVADFEHLVWLCKFVGTKPVTRFASSQDVATDPFLLDASTLNNADTLRLTSYSNLNPPTLDEEAQRNLLVWQVSTRNFGFNAGTDNAIKEAAKLMLIDTKTVSLTYNYVTNPFQIEINTAWYETLGADAGQIGQSSTILLEAVQRAKPIGVVLTHVMTA